MTEHRTEGVALGGPLSATALILLEQAQSKLAQAMKNLRVVSAEYQRGYGDALADAEARYAHPLRLTLPQAMRMARDQKKMILASGPHWGVPTLIRCVYHHNSEADGHDWQIGVPMGGLVHWQGDQDWLYPVRAETTICKLVTDDEFVKILEDSL